MTMKQADGDLRFEELELISRSTKRGYSVGQAAFDTFAELQGIPKLDDFKKEDTEDATGNAKGDTIVKSFRQFATFLIHHKKRDGSHYKPDTQTQYLSNAKNFLVKKFPDATLLKDKHDDAQVCSFVTCFLLAPYPELSAALFPILLTHSGTLSCWLV